MKTKQKTEKHTPGPLEIRPSSNPKNGTDWRDIISIEGEFAPSYVGEALEKDARRIVASWNACESIPTKALEDGVVGELVAALEDALTSVEYHRSHSQTREGRVNAARIKGRVSTVLAKLKGE